MCFAVVALFQGAEPKESAGNIVFRTFGGRPTIRVDAAQNSRLCAKLHYSTKRKKNEESFAVFYHNNTYNFDNFRNIYFDRPTRAIVSPIHTFVFVLNFCGTAVP